VATPGETAIIAGTTYAGQGHLNVIAVAVVAFLAAVTGDSLGRYQRWAIAAAVLAVTACLLLRRAWRRAAPPRSDGA
jgi:hypothetical protein